MDGERNRSAILCQSPPDAAHPTVLRLMLSFLSAYKLPVAGALHSPLSSRNASWDVVYYPVDNHYMYIFPILANIIKYSFARKLREISASLHLLLPSVSPPNQPLTAIKSM